MPPRRRGSRAVSAATSLLIRLSSGQTNVAMTNRLVPIEPVNVRLVRPIP